MSVQSSMAIHPTVDEICQSIWIKVVDPLIDAGINSHLVT